MTTSHPLKTRCGNVARPGLPALALTLLLGGSFLGGSFLGGCGTFLGPASPVTSPEEIAGEDPWELPESSYPSQRIFRMRYDGSEGELSFKLTMYLQDRRQYRMQAALGLGRKLWDLSVDANGWALFIDHGNREYCQAREARRLQVVPLAYLPLSALPKLLLGRLPTAPAADFAREGANFSYRDAGGQLWSARFAGGADGTPSYDPDRLEWWSLVEEGEPVVWWRSIEGGGIFNDRRGPRQVRWVEVVREPLAGPIRPLEVPVGYREGSCGG